MSWGGVHYQVRVIESRALHFMLIILSDFVFVMKGL